MRAERKKMAYFLLILPFSEIVPAESFVGADSSDEGETALWSSFFTRAAGIALVVTEREWVASAGEGVIQYKVFCNAGVCAV